MLRGTNVAYFDEESNVKDTDSEPPWKDGAYISVSFNDVPTGTMQKIYNFASTIGLPFNIYVSHPIPDED